MDFFALPDVFLRQLMRTMEIRDRRTLRLTCRAFKKLVAETHAGCCEGAAIQLDKNVFALDFDDCSVSDTECTEAELKQFLRLRDGLFSRISFEYCLVIFDEKPSTLAFLRRFLETFTIQQLRFSHIRTEAELESAIQLMADFPRSTYTVEIQRFSEPEKLLLLPPVEKLEIKQHILDSEPITMPFDVALNLIRAQKNVIFDSRFDALFLTMSLDEWKTLMETISDGHEVRTVRWGGSVSIVHYLSCFGITKATSTGETILGIDNVWCVKEIENLRFASCGFRYQNCYTTVGNIEWEAGKCSSKYEPSSLHFAQSLVTRALARECAEWRDGYYIFK